MQPTTNGKILNHESEDDVNVEKDRFSTMCVLLWSDEIRYEELLDDLNEGTYKVRDE